jgi:hypothetical protein
MAQNMATTRQTAIRIGSAALVGGAALLGIGTGAGTALSGLVATGLLGMAAIHDRLPLSTVAIITVTFGWILAVHGTPVEAGLTGAYASGLLAGTQERQRS